MKNFLIIAVLSIASLTSCKKDTTNNNNVNTHQTTNTATNSLITSGNYEGSILGYEVFKVNLKADHSATVTKAKAKDNAVTSIGKWEQNGNVITVKTDRFQDHFYVTDNALVKMSNASGVPSQENMKSNKLVKK